MKILLQYLKSKTVWAGIGVFVLTGINASLESGLDKETYTIVGGVIGYLIIHLRALTDKPLKEK